jgi:hypothetical protein
VALRNPVPVYTAASGIEASQLCDALEEAGIEAQLNEDVARAGVPVPPPQGPRVWVDRADEGRARSALEDYERRLLGRPRGGPGGGVRAACEECGKSWTFPWSQRGSVQECPGCGAYVDVPGGEPDWEGDDDEGPGGAHGEARRLPS